jgi:hypothetical protein
MEPVGPGDQRVVYRSHAEFLVSRRMTWASTDELKDHLDRVVDHLVALPEMEEVELDAALGRPTIKLDMIFSFSGSGDFDYHARSVIGDAIREDAGLHEGLLPLAEESQAKSSQNAWAGLRTPLWYVRSFSVEPLEV